ncbi:hypothetical protein JHK86_009608 [Glycine max]|nr:hypothetical protein JHK86_009608 [Glycine max]
MKNWSFDFANRQDLANYAEVCFREFGDRLKHWITLNEPVLYNSGGYEMLQASQKGQIGVTLNSAWVVPLVQSKEDREAAYRGLAFMYDCLVPPLNPAASLPHPAAPSHNRDTRSSHAHAAATPVVRTRTQLRRAPAATHRHERRRRAPTETHLSRTAACSFEKFSRRRRSFVAKKRSCLHADALIRRAEMYQDYMKQIPIPNHRGTMIPFTSWMGLSRSMKQIYGQPLNCLANILLEQWGQLRIGSEDELASLMDRSVCTRDPYVDTYCSLNQFVPLCLYIPPQYHQKN